MLTQLSNWLSQHSLLLSVLAGASIVLLLASIIATPWLVARLPEDYLLQRARKTYAHPMLHLTLEILRTGVGALLILLGLVMLVLPGPGLITLLVGVSIAQFPGKRRLLRFIASREAVYSSLNWMRKRGGKSALLHPYHDDR